MIAALLVLLLAMPLQAAERSSVHTRDFQRANPCPSTGQRRGACPGYVIDHVEPLCAGGVDAPANMQWQTREESIRKDAQERRQCRAMKRR